MNIYIKCLMCFVGLHSLWGCSAILGKPNDGVQYSKIKTYELLNSGEFAFQRENKQWLSLGEDGMYISSAYEPEYSLDYPAEYLDVRQVEGADVAITLGDENKPILLRFIEDKPILKRGATLAYAVEGLCFYKPAGGYLQLFILGDDQHARQVIVQERADDIVLHEVRTIVLPPNAEYCAVDDATHQFFVSEEGVGVWAYSAQAESEVTRSVVDLVSPYGTLLENSGPLAIANGQLLVGELGGATLHKYLVNSKGAKKTHQLNVRDSIAIDDLNFSYASTEGLLSGTLLNENAKNESLPALSQFFINNNVQMDPPKTIVEVLPTAETTPVHNVGDAADDPALWLNKAEPENSKILGTNKQRGLYVYNLEGQQIQELLVGRVNNVDVRQGFTYKGQVMDIAAASQRDHHAIAFFLIHPTTGVVTPSIEVPTTLSDVYGMCMYRGKNNAVYVFINDEDGRYEQYHVTDSAQGWQATLVRSFAVASQPEGCTADEKQHRLFVGEEAVGIWALGAEPTDSTHMTLIASVGTDLVADVEGMELYQTQDKNYLIVSSQGDDSYSIFNASAPYALQGRFRIGLNLEKGIDGASETDGLTVTSFPLGALYPKGLLVVQDGRNLFPEETQNFKLVPWHDIEKRLGL